MKWHLTLLGLLPALATAQEASSSTSSSTPLAIASSTSSTSEATTAASSTTTTLSAVSSASSLSSSTVTASPSIVTVALDGSGQFSVIGSAISYAQSHSYPTVTVKAGTYSESITIAAAATVTIVGEAGASNSYADNAVTISNSVAAPLTISSTAIKGITFRNINFYNSNAASSAGAVSIKGLQHAFYACQFVTAGSGAVTGGNAVALIADSYMEALDKAVYAYPSLYIYNTVLTVTRSGGLMTYTQGYTYNTILYNSTTVFDSCSVVQKTGYTNSFYLFAANQNGSVAVYRNSTMGSYIAPSGASIDSKTQSPVNAYFEFLNSGAGSYANNAVARAPYVKYVTQASQMSVYEIPSFFSNQYPSVATSSTSWIDKDVLARIQASDAAQDALASAAPASSIASSSSSSVASSSSSSAVSSSVVSSSSSSSSPASSATSSSPIASSSQSSSSADTTSLSSASSTTVSSTVSSASSASATASGCVLPTSVPSTAKTVGPAGSCANYTSIAAAVLDLPSDSSTQYVYILAGTYTEKITISRAGSTIFRGQTDNALSYSANLVTIQTSGAVASSAGGSAATAAFQSTQYNAKSLAFYNINFANTYTATANQIAVAFVAKAQKTGFYGCSFTSSQGALLLNYGAFYFAGSFIQGTTDFIWGQGGAYFYNTKIVTTGSTAGQSIAAQDYQSSYGPSIQVYDSCTIVPSSSSVAKSSTYLGRDYSTSSSTTSSRVVYINSYLDAHIMPVGWKVTSSSVNVTFVEANNTGPGAATSLRSSYAQILSSSSAYTVASVLGDASWLDTAAIAPFSGFPDSVYGTTVSSSSTSSVASSTASSIASSTTSSASSTATVATTAVYTVAPTPTGSQYGSVMSAVAALPADGKPYTISILAGTYTEQVWVNRTGLGKVTLVGETDFPNDFTQNQVTIQFSMGVSTSANSDEITPVINWKRTDGSGLALYNIDFINTYAPSSSTAALAADFYGTNMAAYGCSFKGYQDTLLANQGVQVFSNCYIEGSVDFIWGYSKAYFHQCYIASNTAGACITAQNRPSSTWAGGYVFDSCYVTYTSSYGTTTGTTYLGRPWSQYAVVVYKNSYLDKHIAAAGWKIWSTSSPQTDNVLFGEYNNSGPGAWSSSRASFATNLTDSAAQAYNLESFIGSTSWLDSTAYNYVPSYPLGSSTTPTTTTSPTSSATAVATWAHPTDGTTPPAGAVLVSVGGVEAGSYSNLTIALASLPADSSTQIIFMYPGTYTEQVPAINRAGPVMIIGYTTASPGSSYADNTVTVTYAHGLSVSPLPTGHSDAETATVSTASTKISFYNVNIVNSANLDGSLSSYVTLASSIYGDQIGFYGCSFIGWQDTLLTGNKAGYQYYESCYIEGAIDFIWGYSKAYFKGCTIGAKRAGSAITAQSRASSSAIGGYIFDQCLFTEAPDATVDLTQQVYLGRPYSSYALVVVKNSYLDSIIAPSGWKIWGTSSPNTDHITFAEYNNAGPGNWENNTAARVAWQNCTLLTSDTYPLATVMGSTDWIDMTYWNSIVTPSPAPAAPAAPAASAAPYDGTVPPAGAFIVSKTAIDGVTTYDTVQSALNALPTSSKTTATVFIYPGVYEEQLVLNKSGTTIFMGYSTASDDYSKNQVTISYNEGIDTGSDASNSDSATVYATGNYFQAININFKNTFGTTEDYASLGFAVKSSKYAGLYGCQVYGNQDALLINGYLFAYNTYVEGNVDMIWGAGAAYFLNSTISPNEDKVSLTADKRTDNTTAAGFVFDQCTVTPAAGASFSQISLGRPWNSYARVAFIESYLGSCVEAAGWNAWSSSDPRTSGAMFGEFANYGPGASTSGRASFATQLTATDAAQFQLANFFASTSWINMTLVHTTPFTAANVPTVTSSAVPSVTTVTAVSISTVRANLKVTTTALPVTVTQATTTTLSVGTTITPAATTDIETAKSTSTVTTTSSGTDKTVTSVSTVLVNDAVTVTPALATVTSTVKSTITATSVVTVTAKATTVKSSTTVTSIITSTPKATTVTVSQGTSITVTATVTPGTKKVTSSTTVTAGTGGTTTTTAKATTTTVSVTTTTTSTAKSTTTLTCIPSAAKAKRSVIFGRPDDTPLLAVRATTSAPASGTVTVTVVSYTTTFTATGTTTIPGSTTTTLTQVTKTTGKTTTLKPVTVTDTTVSVVLKTVGTTIPGTTATTTVVTTKTTGKATTLKASTTTVYTTSLATATAKATVTAPGVVTTSVETVTSKATTTLPAQTVTVVKSADTTIKTTVTLATPTSTVWKTATVTLKPSVTVTSQSTVTKTTTVKVKTTVTSVVATKTKAGAVACSAV